MKQNKSFDEHIRLQFSKFSTNPQKTDWEIFENLMNAESDFNMLEEDIHFDTKISVEVQNTKIKYASSHWLLFKDQLETRSNRKIKVYTAKVFELIAVLFIVFTITNITEILTKQNLIEDKNNEIIAFHEKQEMLIGEFYDDINSNEKKQNVNFNPEIQSISKTEIYRDLENSPLFVVDISNEDNTIALTNPLANFIEVTYESNSTLEHSELNNFEKNHFEDDHNSGKFSKEINISESNTLDNSRNIMDMQAQTDKLPTILGFVAFNPEFKTPAFFNKIRNKRSQSVAMHFASDVNLINTPFDKVYSVASYNREAFNHSIGVAYAAHYRIFSWEVGVNYANRTYQPKLIKEVHGQFADKYFETSLDRISFDIIKVPVFLKYNLINNPSWKIFLMSGSALNLIVESDFEITTNIRQGRKANRSADSDLRLIEEKNFNNGLFEGGKLKDNYFITAAFGFGIEKHIYKRSNLFIQSIYNRHILSADIGIGPNKDKIHTLSIQAGGRFVLN